ncbi:MAG TPA: hypothetical protein VM076_23080 [Gemmatimonadaceae bacterium]|nr:hypothetical protein [Gemmatimonadaceae bacterium]
MSRLGQPPVYPDIVEEHFDELDALWEHREANVFTADWTLAHLAFHEERAEAHLDGLRLAELHGVELASEKLTSGAPSAATAAAFVLWESHDADARAMLLAEFRKGDPPVRDGIRIALRHLPSAELRQPLLDAMAAAPAVAAAAADVLAFHRSSLPPFDHLIADADPTVVQQALGAAGRMKRLHAQDFARASTHADPSVRLAAFQAAARSGLASVADACRAAAAGGDVVGLAFLGTLGDPSDAGLIERAVRNAELAEVAVSTIGAMGRVQSVPLLLELMGDPVLGVAATAAYKRITGASGVEGEKPFPPPPVAEGEDENESLPPDPAKAKKDWEQRQATLTPDRAWQGGIGITDGVMPAGFDNLALATRRDVYLRLRARGAPVPDIELEALANRQRTT